VGWAHNPGEIGEDSVKDKIINLLHSVRFLLRSTCQIYFHYEVLTHKKTVPLIGINALYIVYLLVLG